MRLSLLATYAAGSIGTGLFSSTSSILLLFFMTDTLGIAAGIAGAVMFIPKFWDVVFDPVVGIVSDRTRSRWGRRQPFLFVGALLSALAFVGMFTVPDLPSPVESAWWVGILFFMGMSAYSIFAVPYAAMPAEMSDDAHQRTVIMSWRMVFVLLGTIAGAVAGPAIVAAAGGGRHGYGVMGVTLAFLIATVMLITAIGVRWMPSKPLSNINISFARQFRLAVTNRPYVVLVLAYVSMLMGVGGVAAAAPYYCVYVLGQGQDSVGIVFACLLLAGIAAMPAWVAVSRRIGKHRAYIAAALIYAATLVTLFSVSRATPLPLFYLACALMGIGFAGTQLFPFSMLTDVIEVDAVCSGMRREGTYTGLFIASEKAGLALGPLITGALLSSHGFVASISGMAVQPDSALQGIALAFSVIPALCVVVGVLILFAYRLPQPLREAPT